MPDRPIRAWCIGASRKHTSLDDPYWICPERGQDTGSTGSEEIVGRVQMIVTSRLLDRVFDVTVPARN